MASKTFTQSLADGTQITMRRTTPQGRKPSRKYAKILLRVPVEYLEIMKQINEKCGGCMTVTTQIQDAIRVSLCDYVYT